MGLPVEKGPDAYRTISEVAEDLDLPQHVLRFWETRFAQIRPLKRGGGRRYYRPDDVDLLRGIRQLLYGDGYTIRGVQQILREQGVRHVQSVGRAVEAEEARTRATGTPAGYAGGRLEQRTPVGRASEGGVGLIDYLPSLRSSRPVPELPRVVEVPIPPRPASASPATGEEDMPPFPFRRPLGAGQGADGPPPAVHAALEDGGSAPSGPGTAAATRSADPRASAETTKLSPEAIRLLKATLFELSECRRLLDAGRDERS